MPSLWRSWSVWWGHLEIKRSKQVPSKAVSRAFLSLARFQVDPPISHSEPSTSLWGRTFTSCEISDSIISQSSPPQTGCVACARFVSPGSSKGTQKQAVVPAVRSPGRSTRHHQDLLRGIAPCPRGPRGPSWCWHADWTTWLLPGIGVWWALALSIPTLWSYFLPFHRNVRCQQCEFEGVKAHLRPQKRLIIQTREFYHPHMLWLIQAMATSPRSELASLEVIWRFSRSTVWPTEFGVEPTI